MIGQVIQGRYEIEHLLGEGGFGVVYQAEDLKFGRKIAIKLLNQSVKSNSDHAQRFITEAKITSQLSHRNIPVVYDFGESEGKQLFIVTELFNGKSLEEAIDLTSLSPRQASWVVNEVNEALIVAHNKGITHRDVKPPNIFIHEGGGGEEVKLLDFGIAKLNNNQSHTLTGQLFGTPYFMAPEQILGQKTISPATDLYSLGAVLFYCLTRTVPYDGDSQFMIFNKHVNSDTPMLVDRAPHLRSTRLQELLNVLMEKNPKHRPQNSYEAREIFAEIEYIASSIDDKPRSPLIQAIRQSTHPSSDTFIGAPHSLPRTDTPIEPYHSIPEPFALSSVISSHTPVITLDEALTLPPIDEQWRPTAKLDLSELEDPLIGEDDTTDNISRSRRENTLGLFSRSDSQISEGVTQLSVRNELNTQSTRVGTQNFDEDDAAFFERDIDEITGTVVKQKSSHRVLILGAVFLVGIGVSLLSFNQEDSEIGSDALEPNQKLRPYDDISGLDQASSDSANSGLKTSEAVEDLSNIDVPLPLPESVSAIDQLPSTQNLNIEPALPLPIQKTHKTTHKPERSRGQNTKTKRRAGSKHTVQQKRRAKSKDDQGKNKKKSRRSQTSSSRDKGTRSSQKTALAPTIALVNLTVMPRKVTYMAGDLIRLSASAHDLNGSTINSKLVYRLKSSSMKSTQVVSRNSLKLKQGDWTIQACSTTKPESCSSAIKLIVLDHSSLLDL